MPKEYTLATLPKPTDTRITLRTLPVRRIFSHRYVNNWSENLFTKKVNKTKEEMLIEGLTAKGQPIWARYNSPFTSK